ncbi:MAG TPA: tripartite tricarboxylate transporter substrate binding protein [Xanthobacteraceae bacterium]|nr:tripartite tricarboxylate transporter substrate binding protein [Xanthobacteraceae bacterium]
MSVSRIATLLIGAAGLVLVTLPARAQEFPTREIKTICSFAPGTGADIVVRYYAQKLSELAGKAVVTENKPGLQGLLGTEAAIRAKPDGYTISINPASSTLAASPHLFKKMPFDPQKDVDFAGMILSTSFVLVVTPNSNINSVAELTKKLKEKDGDRFYAGSTNTGIVASELYIKALGLDVKRVNYRSAFDAMNEMVSGKIDFFFTDTTSALGQIAGGKYRALAVTSGKRLASFPNTPTMTESGYPMDISPWWGILVPAGTPKPIIDKYAAWFAKISAMPETREFLLKNGLEPFMGDAAAMRKLLIDDTARWGEWVKLANIEVQ